MAIISKSPTETVTAVVKRRARMVAPFKIAIARRFKHFPYGKSGWFSWHREAILLLPDDLRRILALYEEDKL